VVKKYDVLEADCNESIAACSVESGPKMEIYHTVWNKVMR
jgi:hypothetical protein